MSKSRTHWNDECMPSDHGVNIETPLPLTALITRTGKYLFLCCRTGINCEILLCVTEDFFLFKILWLSPDRKQKVKWKLERSAMETRKNLVKFKSSHKSWYKYAELPELRNSCIDFWQNWNDSYSHFLGRVLVKVQQLIFKTTLKKISTIKYIEYYFSPFFNIEIYKCLFIYFIGLKNVEYLTFRF